MAFCKQYVFMERYFNNDSLSCERCRMRSFDSVHHKFQSTYESFVMLNPFKCNLSAEHTALEQVRFFGHNGGLFQYTSLSESIYLSDTFSYLPRDTSPSIMPRWPPRTLATIPAYILHTSDTLVACQFAIVATALAFLLFYLRTFTVLFRPEHETNAHQSRHTLLYVILR